MKNKAKEEGSRITRLPDDHEAAGGFSQKNKGVSDKPSGEGLNSGKAGEHRPHRQHSGSDGSGNMGRGSNH
ncbi:hypothetical protein V9K67_12195 [Paraflavisolibacter sp. H34]|uniref:hypothetical protein n=1 Tax=Huijunlia imazamoxiresistens TaxID=3127457 RepID=UPI003019BED2